MNSAANLPFVYWSAPRKAAAGIFVVSGFLALAFAAIYLAGVLFLALNKVDPRQARLTSIVQYWTHYADDARLRKKLWAATGVSGLGLLVLVPAGLLAAARTRRPLHGDARFASEAEVARAGLTISDGSPGILIGMQAGRVLSLRGQLSVLLSAPTRSGKGVSVVMSNLLNWPDSVVVLDIKGENYDKTAGFRALHGQAVYAFSPFDEEGRSHRWNPLSAVRTSVGHCMGDLFNLGQVLFPNDGSGTSSEAFFNDQARNLFLGLGLLLLETPSLPRTIGEMLRQSSGKGRPLKEHLTDIIEQRRASDQPLSPACTDALQRLLSNSENTLSSVVATFNAPLTIFADPAVDAATSGDDFRLEDLRRRPMSIYIRIPPLKLADVRRLLALFYSQLVHLNTRALPEQDPSLKLQCLLINDEFTAMGRVGAIPHAAAFLAGYNLRLLTIVQAMSQLDAVYGNHEARTFATNHGLQILFAPREQRDANDYSDMLGYYTERVASHGRSQSFSAHTSSSVSRNESDQRRALMLPQEVKQLGTERLIVLLENCRPIHGEKLRFHKDPILSKRVYRAPIVPCMDVELHLARVQQRWRYADDELPPGTTLSVERIALDPSKLPPMLDQQPIALGHHMLNLFVTEPSSQSAMGGSIEAAADADGVLIDEPDATKGADFT